MKILVSTKETQGQRPNDFCWVPEGEPVVPGFQCDGGSTDDGCGCSRSMVGIECRKGTTTFKVVEDNSNIPDVVKLSKHLQKYRIGDILEFLGGELRKQIHVVST